MLDLREVERFPVSAFSVVMGLAGLALALGAQTRGLGIGDAWALLVTVPTSLLFLVLAALYGVKVARYPAAVRAEWAHPVKLAFFPTVAISLTLLAAAWLPHAPTLARALSVAGCALQLALTLAVLSAWLFRGRFEVGHANPAWFLPVVGNILVAVPGATLLPGEVSWFFFGVGLLFWVLLFAVLLHRVVFHPALPEKLMPTFFIFIAPPALAFLAYLGLTGNLDPFARVTYYTALFLTLLLLLQSPRFVRLPFSLSGWAYSFPVATVTVATSAMHARTGHAFFQILAWGLLGLLLFIVGVLVTRTSAVVRRHGLALDEA